MQCIQINALTSIRLNAKMVVLKHLNECFNNETHMLWLLRQP